MTPAEIALALREANSDQPVGLLSDQSSDAILRVEGRIKDPKQFANMVVARRGNLVLTLSDLGHLVEREREPDSIARIKRSCLITKKNFANFTDAAVITRAP